MVSPDDLIDKQIFPFLKENLPEERWRHVQSVTEFAGELAGRHGLDRERARLAGALHDIARCWSLEKLVKYVQGRNLKVPEPEFTIRHKPILLHSYVGADLARSRFGVSDGEILSAIEKHSLG